MSQENVEIILRHFEFWNEGHDPEALASRFWHEEVEWIEPPDSLDAGVYRGRSAAVGYMKGWTEHMGEIPVTVDQLLPAGDEVVASVRLQLRGTVSGVALDNPIYYVVRIRDGRIDRIRPFYERGQALEAAGLSD